jgi:ketosteroid isomerase-like protein
VVAAAHPEIQLDFSAAPIFPGLEDTYRGREGVRAWWHTFRDPFEYFRVSALEFLAEGDNVAAAIHWEARGKSSGAEVELDFANLWTFRDELIIGFAGHHTLDAAAEAAGITVR